MLLKSHLAELSLVDPTPGAYGTWHCIQYTFPSDTRQIGTAVCMACSVES